MSIEGRRAACVAEWKKHHAKFATDVPTITSSELLARLKKAEDDGGGKERRIIIVDVRTESEQDVSMIPGAITLDALEGGSDGDCGAEEGSVCGRGDGVIKTIREDDTQVDLVVYCTVGYRSGMAALRLRKKYPTLFRNVYNLDGIVAFTYAARSLSLPASGEEFPGETKRVHVYGAKWKLAHPDYDQIVFETDTANTPMSGG